MAENVNITSGTGTTVSTDEVTINAVLVQVQRVKNGWGADNFYNDVSFATPLPTQEVGIGTQVGADFTLTWANSALANIAVTSADLANPATLQPQALYKITVYNPSTVTALTVTIQNRETLAGAARYAELTRFGVALNSTADFIVQGMFVGEAGRIVAQNDTALGASNTFSATFRIREV